MNNRLSAWEHLEKLAWRDVLIIAAVLILARLLILAMRWALRRLAEMRSHAGASPFFEYRPFSVS